MNLLGLELWANKQLHRSEPVLCNSSKKSYQLNAVEEPFCPLFAIHACDLDPDTSSCVGKVRRTDINRIILDFFFDIIMMLLVHKR